MELRYWVLIWMTIQNSSHTLLLRYVRSRDVSEMFLPSLAVLWTEIIKSAISFATLVFFAGGTLKGVERLRSGIFDAPVETGKMGIPSLVYTLQNNLFYLAASHLDSGTFIITSQLKILTTALFSRAVLGRRLGRLQWVALLCLFVGVGIVQIPAEEGAAAEGSVDERPVVGLFAILAATTLSGFGGIFFELLLKKPGENAAPDDPTTLWVRNLQLSLWSIPISGLMIAAKDSTFIAENGFFYGFDSVVWFTSFWYGIGGLSVSLCIAYADNILKNYATSVAILISTVVAIAAMGFHPGPGFFPGAGLVLASLWLYTARPKRPDSPKLQTSLSEEA